MPRREALSANLFAQRRARIGCGGRSEIDDLPRNRRFGYGRYLDRDDIARLSSVLDDVTDRIEGALQSRFTAFYTAAFGIGTSFSLLASGGLAAVLPWRSAFHVLSLGPIVAALVVVLTWAWTASRSAAAVPRAAAQTPRKEISA